MAIMCLTSSVLTVTLIKRGKNDNNKGRKERTMKDNIADRAGVNSKQLKFTLPDVSRCLQITESTVSISYTHRCQRPLVSHVNGQESNGNKCH
jgi:hypothetical protein